MSTLAYIQSAGKSLGVYMNLHNKNHDPEYKQAQYHLRTAYAILKKNGAK